MINLNDIADAVLRSTEGAFQFLQSRLITFGRQKVVCVHAANITRDFTLRAHGAFVSLPKLKHFLGDCGFKSLIESSPYLLEFGF